MANNSTEVEVMTLPDCDVHKYELGQPGVPAAYDLRTKSGQWGNVCEEHRKSHAMYPDLGLGKGQRLILVKAD